MNTLGEQLLSSSRFSTQSNSSVLELSCVTVGELGFGSGAKFNEVVDRASSFGLELCSLEVAVQFRLQFLEQQEGALGQQQTKHCAPPGSITVASGAPASEEEEPWGFYLRRIAGELWLRGYRSPSSHIWSPQDMLAFAVAESAA